MSSVGSKIVERFRGFLPVVVDVETGGFNPKTDALLEIAAIILTMNDAGQLIPADRYFFPVRPFNGSNLEPKALAFNGIEPYSALRGAVPEDEALHELYGFIRHAIKNEQCQRAVLVGHNAFFDHAFLKAASERAEVKRDPFHPFSCFDTVSLSALAFGQTVLAKACDCAGIEFNSKSAHSALYDAEKTAELFCLIINRWHVLGGWPLTT